MQRPHQPSRPLQIRITLTGLRQRAVEEDLRQTARQLLGEGCALAKGKRQLFGGDLLGGQAGEEGADLGPFCPLELLWGEDAAGADGLEG